MLFSGFLTAGKKDQKRDHVHFKLRDRYRMTI